MPKLDKTGPLGQGPMTGRAMGNCEGARGFGCCRQGRGLGVGFGRFFRSSGNQVQNLQEREKMLTEELEAIKLEKGSLKDQK